MLFIFAVPECLWHHDELAYADSNSTMCSLPFKAQNLCAHFQQAQPCMQTRYTAVRRQTAARPGEREVQVLDYQNTAFELLPLLATAYALIFMVCLLPPFQCFPAWHDSVAPWLLACARGWLLHAIMWAAFCCQGPC